MSGIRRAMVSAASRLVWLALMMGAIGTFISWRLASINDRAHIRRMTQLAASAVAADLTADMESWTLGQVRLAKMWEFGEPSYEQWTAFANLYIEHHPGCLAIEWLDPKYEERWIARSSKDPLPPINNSVREALLSSSLASRQPALSSLLTSPGGRKLWFTVVPIYQKDHFRGFVLGSFDAQRSFDKIFEDVKGLDFSVAIEEKGEEAFRLEGTTPENERDWAEAIDVPLRGPSWRVKVWSKPEAMRVMRSHLPGMTLFFGLAATVLLVVIARVVDKLRTEVAARKRVEKSLRTSQERFSGILEISAEAVISTDAELKVTLFNQSAEKVFGYSAQEVLGQSIDMLIPQRFRAVHGQHVSKFAAAAAQNLLISKRRQIFALRKDGTEFPMAASVSRLDVAGERYFTVICSDITEQVFFEETLRRSQEELEERVLERTADLLLSNQSLQEEIVEHNRAEEEVQELSRRMMRVQEEERRNLARELHDGAAQNLVALSLNLARIRDGGADEQDTPVLTEECIRLVETCTTELRTISYLLHPPLLEELGLSRTLRGYVDGFCRRSGIQVILTTDGDLDHLGFDVDLTIFRIVQEALSNVHRHSHSPKASILLVRRDGELTLEIADQGRGIRLGEEVSGVGISGMRERVRLLKGKLEIKSGSEGTTITVTLPVAVRPASSGAVA